MFDPSGSFTLDSFKFKVLPVLLFVMYTALNICIYKLFSLGSNS